MESKIKYPNLLAEMARHGEKQKEIGKLLGVTAATVCRKLSGQIDWSFGEVDILCEHYNKDYYYLFK